jgi:hypothetical protein
MTIARIQEPRAMRPSLFRWLDLLVGTPSLDRTHFTSDVAARLHIVHAIPPTRKVCRS